MFVKYDSLILNLKIDKHLYFSLFKRPLLVILWMDDTWVNIAYNQVEVDNKTLKILFMEEILLTTRDLGCKKNVNNGINYQPELVIAGFLNHQQYVSHQAITA